MADYEDCAVIFDVDGPLLELTAAEEDLFLAPMLNFFGITNPSRQWSEYPVCNDLEIYREILRAHFKRSPSPQEIEQAVSDYVGQLQAWLEHTPGRTEIVPGAKQHLNQLANHPKLKLGIATANLLPAAKLRLEDAKMWAPVAQFAGAAEHGGAKRDILAYVIKTMNIPPQNIVFIGDNLNDLDAATANGTHFIGFSRRTTHRNRLLDHGAKQVTDDHQYCYSLIKKLIF